MEPSEASDAVEALGKDVLEEASDELEGFEVDMTVLAGVAFTVRPSQTAIGKKCHGSVSRRGLEHVATQIAQGVFAGSGLGAVDDPTLLPDLAQDVLVGIRT